MEFTILLSILVNFVLIQARTEVEYMIPKNYTRLDISENALGKAHYNPWTCSYKSEPGYKCVSCTAALHCYPANLALLVQCAGLFPYCRNGYCSRWKTEGCNEEYMYAEGTHGPLRLTTPSHDKITVAGEEHSSIDVTENTPNENHSTLPISHLTDSNKVEEIVVNNRYSRGRK